MQLSTHNILSICNDIFNPEVCHQMARFSGFIQRSSSKIKGHEFLKTLVLPSSGLAEDSLNGLCERMREFNPDANISASAFAQRINTQASVRFLRMCFEKILKITREKFEKQYSSLEGSLKIFNNVYIHDSTVLEINKRLAKFFPGTNRGGKNGLSCKSQLKIDLIHNFSIGQIAKIKLYEGKRPDQALTSEIEDLIQKGDLVLRDLGYFKIESLKNIEEKEAYFISRFPSHVKVYLKKEDKNPIDLAKYLNKNFKKFQAIDLTVYISAERCRVRLIAYRMPEAIVAERKRKAHKAAKERGRVLSKEKLSLSEFSLFITNVPSEILSVYVIGTIYRLRWEIELIFKTWKSYLKIDVLEGVSPHRILCLMWSRLCMVILVANITATFLNLAKKLCERELSPIKLISYLLRNGKLCRAIQTNTLEDLEKKMVKDISRRFLKEKRCRLTMRETAIASESYYGIYNISQITKNMEFALA